MFYHSNPCTEAVDVWYTQIPSEHLQIAVRTVCLLYVIWDLAAVWTWFHFSSFQSAHIDWLLCQFPSEELEWFPFIRFSNSKQQHLVAHFRFDQKSEMFVKALIRLACTALKTNSFTVYGTHSLQHGPIVWIFLFAVTLVLPVLYGWLWNYLFFHSHCTDLSENGQLQFFGKPCTHSVTHRYQL